MFKISCSLVLFILSSAIFKTANLWQYPVPSHEVLIYSENDSVVLSHDEEGKKVDVWIGENLLTSYIYSDNFKPFLYPVYTANGNPVTRGYPINPRSGEATDHPHQVGFWLNYGDVNGLDFWNNSERIPSEARERYGTIAHIDIENMEYNGNSAVLEVVKHWLTSEGVVLIVENTRYHFSLYSNRGAGDIRMIDRITRLTAQDSDIVFTDNKEGMLGLRVARELEHHDRHDDATGLYISSEGFTGHDVWGTRNKWMNLIGQIGDEKVSIAIFDHPGNIGFPTYWHARGYGLYAANPLGKLEMSGGFEELNYQLASGTSLTFMHRVILSSGEHISREELEKFWQEWTQY